MAAVATTIKTPIQPFATAAHLPSPLAPPSHPSTYSPAPQHPSSPLSPQEPASFRLHDDALGKKIRLAIMDFNKHGAWGPFAASQRGNKADISASVHHLNHPASSLLQHLRSHGAPIPMSTRPWSSTQRDNAIRRGPHKSAKEAVDFVREEFLDFMNKRFWNILPYRLIKHLPNLRLSPLGVVPQQGRRPRLIVDLSFYFVNQETAPVAPSEAMQFGRTLQRLLQRILMSNPEHGPVYISKIDIADGFYRIGLAPYDAPKLAVLLPRLHDEEPLVAFPLVLPMA